MSNFRAIRWVLVYTMILNLIVTVAKLAVGYSTGSLSLVADGYDSFFDSASNVVGLVGIYIASRPPDPNHPYGHRKFETLAAASISVLLFVTTVQLVQSAIGRLRNPSVPEVNVFTYAALALSIGMHLYVSVYENRRGRQLKSEVLVADARHTRADVLVSVSVLVGMIMVRLGYPIVDAILALIIAVLIAKIGVEIILSGSKVLADAAALDAARVQRIVDEVPGVQTCHRIRSRGQEDDIHLDLHVRVLPGLPIEEAHGIAHEVERRLRAGIEGVRDVVVHVEPQNSTSVSPHDLDQRIRQLAARIPGTAVHSIHAYDLQGRLYVTLHLEVDRDLPLQRAHELASQLEELLRGELPSLDAVNVHIEPSEPQQRPAVAVDDKLLVQVRIALEEAATELEALDECHDVHVLRDGGQVEVSAHCTCDSALSVDEAHLLTGQIEQRVRERVPAAQQVVIHMEPRSS